MRKEEIKMKVEWYKEQRIRLPKNGQQIIGLVVEPETKQRINLKWNP